MKFFKRRKKKKEAEAAELVMDQEKSFLDKRRDFTDKKQVQHFVLECCEQIIETTKEIEEEKAEYRIVTEYLNDIQKLEELPEEEKDALKDAALNVQKLDHLRDEYKKAERKISDAQFTQMQQEEERMPDAIRKLQANEAYQSTVKKDMNYLEGEKTEWYYTGMECRHLQKVLKYVSFVVMAVFAVSVAVMFFLQSVLYMDMTYAWLLLFFLAGVGGFLLYMKMSSNRTEIKRAEVNMNRAIELLNGVKFKYINITNAVDYAREKYHVKNGYDMNYIWEQYLTEVKEREKFNQTNEDLEYFSQKLINLMNQHQLYDAQVWINQSTALIEKKEMVEVKHNLIVRRQKLRSRIDYNTQNIRERRGEIEYLLIKENIYTPEVREILNSIDRLGGFKS